MMNQARLAAELERYHQDCYGWAVCCCNGDREQAQDVLQTAYLKILQGRARFEGRSSLKTWLFAVVHKTACSQLRRWLRRLRLSSGEAPLRFTSQGADEIEQGVRRGQIRHQLEKMLRQLSERQRQVLHLVFYQEMTLQEASRVMQASIGSVRVHYHRGKSRLRRMIEQEGLTDEFK